MDAKTTHQLDLLARAEIGGVAVHDLGIPCTGLRGPIGFLPCPVVGYRARVKGKDRRWPKGEEYDPCGGSGYIPNPNPMTLKDAVLAQKSWSLHFWPAYLNRESEWSENVTIGLNNNNHWKQGVNLIDAVFQATLTLKPTNWEKCEGCTECFGADPDPMNPERSPECHGTGYICVVNVKAT